MEWINIEDQSQTPPSTGDYFIGYGYANCTGCNKRMQVNLLKFDDHRNEFVFGDYDCIFRITHWMPLPELPLSINDNK